jgi:fatty acid amide hydrolase 2
MLSDIWSAMLTAAGGTPYSVLLGNGKPVSTAFEFLRAALGISPYTLPSIVLAFFEKFPKPHPRPHQENGGLPRRRTR